MEPGEVAAELYSLPLDTFTRVRNERADAAKAGGDAALGARIRSLKKPSVAAWVVNMLARHHADEVQQVLALGGALAEAQANLDAEELRDLGRQRHKLVTSMSRQARELATRLGRPVGPATIDEVAETLRAAMADAAAGAAVAEGLLVLPLAAVGWGSVELENAVAVPADSAVLPTALAAAPARIAQTKAERKTPEDRLREARRELEESELEEQEAQAQLTATTRRLSSLGRQAETLSTEVDELRRQLVEAESELSDAEREARELRRFRDAAERAAASAQRSVERARSRVERINE